MNRLQKARFGLGNQPMLTLIEATASTRVVGVARRRQLVGSRARAIRSTVPGRAVWALAVWFALMVLSLSGFLANRVFGQEAAPAAPPQPATAPAPAVPAPPAGIRSVSLPPALTAKATVAAMERVKGEGLAKADFSPQWPGYEEFRRYYQLYQFGKLMDASYVAEYGKITQSILEDLDRAQKQRSPAANTLGGWVVAGARAIATGNYHPVARVTSTLMLAQTDDQPADLRAGRPPVPAAAALPVLVQLYRTETNPDGVRAAALQGILRHVQMGSVTDQRFRDGIAGIALQLIESNPPAGRSSQAHAFLQRYAVDILGVLADPNTSPKTAETLVSVSTQPGRPNLIAAYAASKVGRFQPGKAKVSEASKILQSWAARGAETIDREIDRIAKLDPPIAVRDQPQIPVTPTGGASGGYDPSMAGGMMPGMDGGMAGMGDYDPGMMSGMDGMGMGGMEGDMYGGMMGMPGGGMMGPITILPQPLEIVTARRSINDVFQQLQVGATGQAAAGLPKQASGGLLAVADPADKANIESWVKTLGEVVTAINDRTLTERKKFVESLTEQSNVLKKLAGIEVKEDEAATDAQRAIAGGEAALGPEIGSGPMDPAAGFPPAATNVPGVAAAPGVNPQAAPGVNPQAPPGVNPQAAPGVNPQAAPGVNPQGPTAAGALPPVGTAGQPENPLADPVNDPLATPPSNN